MALIKRNLDEQMYGKHHVELARESLPHQFRRLNTEELNRLVRAEANAPLSPELWDLLNRAQTGLDGLAGLVADPETKAKVEEATALAMEIRILLG